MCTDKNNDLQTQQQQVLTHDGSAGIRIGIAGNYADTDETRILLTPEACGILIGAGYTVLMESGAAVDISFTDENYAEFGVKIVSREEMLKADVVLSYSPLNVADVNKMRKGAMLLSMMSSTLFERPVINALQENKIIMGCLDNMISHNDEPVFANIIDEIDGRAAVMYAQDFLSFLGGGKGVLLAGVAGINPCEVLLIGSGNRITAAANAALSAGAIVTVMDNDVSMLQSVRDYCGQGVMTISIHPRVLLNKVKTADVILMDTCTRPFEFPKHLSAVMKESAYVLNFNETSPSLAVPRTVAMGLSNVLVNFFDEMAIKGGVESMIVATPGLQSGIVTIDGKLVDKLIGSYLNMPCIDINVLLSASN